MAADLLDALERNGQPICSARDGRWAVEMVAGIYQSQLAQARASFPLTKRPASILASLRTQAGKPAPHMPQILMCRMAQAFLPVR